jgi:hypothetical protein
MRVRSAGELAAAVVLATTSAVDRQHLLIEGRKKKCGVPPIDRRYVMTFLERLFGITLDGGNGSFELLLFLIPLTGILLLRVSQFRRRQS